jgi:hypothetical protein
MSALVQEPKDISECAKVPSKTRKKTSETGETGETGETRKKKKPRKTGVGDNKPPNENNQVGDNPNPDVLDSSTGTGSAASIQNPGTISPQQSTIPAFLTIPKPTDCAAWEEKINQLVESAEATREFVDATLNNLCAKAEALRPAINQIIDSRSRSA